MKNEEIKIPSKYHGNSVKCTLAIMTKKQVLCQKFARHNAKIASFANMNKLVTYSLRKSGWNLLIFDYFCYKILSFLINISFHGKTGFYEVKTKPRNLLLSELCYAKWNKGPDIFTKNYPKTFKKTPKIVPKGMFWNLETLSSRFYHQNKRCKTIFLRQLF